MAAVKTTHWQPVLPLNYIIPKLISNQPVAASAIGDVKIWTASTELYGIIFEVVLAAAITSFLVLQDLGLLIPKNLLTQAMSLCRIKATTYWKTSFMPIIRILDLRRDNNGNRECTVC